MAQKAKIAQTRRQKQRRRRIADPLPYTGDSRGRIATRATRSESSPESYYRSAYLARISTDQPDFDLPLPIAGHGRTPDPELPLCAFLFCSPAFSTARTRRTEREYVYALIRRRMHTLPVPCYPKQSASVQASARLPNTPLAASSRRTRCPPGRRPSSHLARWRTRHAYQGSRAARRAPRVRPVSCVLQKHCAAISAYRNCGQGGCRGSRSATNRTLPEEMQCDRGACIAAVTTVARVCMRTFKRSSSSTPSRLTASYRDARCTTSAAFLAASSIRRCTEPSAGARRSPGRWSDTCIDDGTMQPRRGRCTVRQQFHAPKRAPLRRCVAASLRWEGEWCDVSAVPVARSVHRVPAGPPTA